MQAKHLQKRTILSFELESELFGVEIINVLEVLRNENISHIPETKEYIEGIIQFRGDVITVVDLRTKLGLPKMLEGGQNVIMVFDFDYREERIRLGVLVDRVINVFDMLETEVKPVPEFGDYLNPRFLSGIYKTADSFMVLIDVQKVFAVDEIKQIQELPTSNEVNIGTEPSE